MATRDSVTDAVESLRVEGLDATVERVRAKLGGGSYTTISRFLAEVVAQRQSVNPHVSELPADLVEIAQKAVAAIYGSVQRTAAAKIDTIDSEARKQIEQAQRSRIEASLEIERLETELDNAGERLLTSTTAMQAALARAERAEAKAEAGLAEIERMTRVQSDLQAAMQAARSGEKDAGDRSIRAESARRATEVELQKEINGLLTRLARAEARGDAAGAEGERIGQLLGSTQNELRLANVAIESLRHELIQAQTTTLSLEKQMQRLDQSLVEAQHEERQARDELAEVRGQIKAKPKNPPAKSKRGA